MVATNTVVVVGFVVVSLGLHGCGDCSSDDQSKLCSGALQLQLAQCEQDCLAGSIEDMQACVHKCVDALGLSQKCMDCAAKHPNDSDPSVCGLKQCSGSSLAASSEGVEVDAAIKMIFKDLSLAGNATNVTSGDCSSDDQSKLCSGSGVPQLVQCEQDCFAGSIEDMQACVDKCVDALGLSQKCMDCAANHPNDDDPSVCGLKQCSGSSLAASSEGVEVDAAIKMIFKDSSLASNAANVTIV
jgi:hypothetical protein